MRFQDKSMRGMTQEQMLYQEKMEHDKLYKASLPFGLPTMEFSKEDVWRINDHCYKKGTYRRGWRKRRLFVMMDLENSSGKRILDVGCGNGQHSVFFAMCGAKCWGVDISNTAVSVAKKIAEANKVTGRCIFEVQNAGNLPYKNRFFDYVVFNAVYHHAIKYEGVIDEAHRVVKKGGKIYFAEGMRNIRIYRIVRGIYRKFNTKSRQLGDVDLESTDINMLLKGLSDVYIEQFCLFEKLKEGIGRPQNNNLLVRIIFFILKALDDLLFWLFPPLRKWGLEIVGYGVK